MSLLTQAYLLDKYGPRLTIDQLGSVLSIEPRTIYNQISANEFKVGGCTPAGPATLQDAMSKRILYTVIAVAVLLQFVSCVFGGANHMPAVPF